MNKQTLNKQTLKHLLKYALAITVLVIQAPAFAFNSSNTGYMIGTGTYPLDINLKSFYFQTSFTEHSTLIIEYSWASTLELSSDKFFEQGRGVSYKYYFDTPGNGPYWKAGMTTIRLIEYGKDIEKHSPIYTIGYEKSGKQYVAGMESGIGSAAGWALYNVYVGFKF